MRKFENGLNMVSLHIRIISATNVDTRFLPLLATIVAFFAQERETSWRGASTLPVLTFAQKVIKGISFLGILLV